MNKVRVRFAPSPTGSPHIGGVRTAIFNWLFSRAAHGAFVLRIEDTDQKRLKPEAAQEFLDAFRWIGLDWDEGPDISGAYGPYIQSQRIDLHRQMSDQLLAGDRAYPCFCTSDELAAEREAARRDKRAPLYNGRCRDIARQEALKRMQDEPFVLRLRVPQQGYTLVHDLIRGDVRFENKVLDDFVIMKSDGTPTYNFACAIDDHGMAITHVIRAEEHLSNTPKQILVYQALGWDLPLFAHVPMILAPDRSKLSKRHGATSVAEFREMGILPEALANYLMLLGWSPDPENEIVTLEEAVTRFRLEDVNKNAAIYDIKKLTWINGVYLRSVPIARLLPDVMRRLREAQIIGEEAREEVVANILSLVRERVYTLSEVVDAARYFFRDPQDYDAKGARKHFSAPSAAEALREASAAFAAVDGVLTKEGAEELITAQAAVHDLPRAALIHPIRLACTGSTMGPGLFEILEVLGAPTVARRLQRAAKWIEEQPKPSVL